jgi:hypothetical protein
MKNKFYFGAMASLQIGILKTNAKIDMIEKSKRKRKNTWFNALIK